MARNIEVAEMTLVIDELKPYFALCGLSDPNEDLEAFDIDYAAIQGTDEAFTEAHAELADVEESFAKILTGVRRDWEGAAADSFATYHDLVSSGMDDVLTRIDSQASVVSEVAAHLKTIIGDVHEQVMEAAVGISNIMMASPIPLPGTGGVAVQALWREGEMASFNAITDWMSLLVGGVNAGLVQVANTIAKVDNAEEDLGSLAELTAPDGSKISPLGLDEEKEFGIVVADGTPEEPVVSGFEEDTVARPDQWVQR
ncbi:WXG100 family type VII secretion target [Saccharopolyspora sp. NPDC002578]